MRQVKVTKEFEHNGTHYGVGTVLDVIGENGMRGLDLQDKDGNVIAETGMMMDHFEIMKPKTRVWTVTHGVDYDGEGLVGIFSTEEKAIAYAEQMVELHNGKQDHKSNMFEKTRDHHWRQRDEYIDIERMQLDPDFDWEAV